MPHGVGPLIPSPLPNCPREEKLSPHDDVTCGKPCHADVMATVGPPQAHSLHPACGTPNPEHVPHPRAMPRVPPPGCKAVLGAGRTRGGH